MKMYPVFKFDSQFLIIQTPNCTS